MGDTDKDLIVVMIYTLLLSPSRRKCPNLSGQKGENRQANLYFLPGDLNP